ncbi:AAA family ATPase [Halobacteriales archaeon QS_1_67_19]|nr:MAG: AAA family ATPase [Halobacteriales archaeon QS_1_67_19]
MKLTVKPLKQKDAGRGLAAIDRQSMHELGVENGDYIVIEGTGQGRAVARVWPGYPEDEGRGVVRIDGQLRKEAGVGIDDKVTVEPADVKPANSVTIALPQNLQIRGNIAPHIRDKLSGQAITQGQNVPFGFGLMGMGSGQSIPLKVASTDPEGTVVVTDSTEINVSERPAEEISAEGAGGEGTPSVTYEDIGGLEGELEQVREMIELPMRHPELFQRLGIEPPKGVVLHGPPGTGKTLMAKAVANEIDAHFQTISGPEIMSKYYGESEEKLREVFEEAEQNAPAIVFIDELDSIAPKREEAGGDVERRVVAQLLSLMDGLESRGDVTVIAATNRIDAVDPALRRPGRFDREIEIGVPDRDGRLEILQVHTRGMPLADGVDMAEYADNTHGFVGADLENLAKEGAMNALRRIRPQIDLEEEIPADVLDSLKVTERDFKEALKGIEPSALREVFVEVPDVTWDQVGGLEDTNERLRETIQWPLDYPEVFDALDMQAAKGVLLYGPPGTGKTLMAKAVANESDSNFISIKGPELLSKWVGESEKGVREVFSKARENAPTVVFFDEIDSIATERGSGGGGGAEVSERVVSQLLTELDGLEELEDVVVIATSNRPDLIDSALLRPGRLDRHVHVPVPDEEARRQIFEVHTREKPLADDVDLDWLAAETEGYVGADVEAVAREASMAASREFIHSVDPEDVGESVGNVRISKEHFEEALDEVTPSVTEETKERYEEIEEQFESAEPETEQDQLGRTFQ